MFSLGPMEMAIVGIVAILLFGKRLPEVMKSLGKSYSEFRKGLSDIQSTVNYNDFTSTSSSYNSSNKSYSNDDYDEPTAPKFEPPPAEESVTSEPASSIPNETIEKPIGE